MYHSLAVYAHKALVTVAVFLVLVITNCTNPAPPIIAPTAPVNYPFPNCTVDAKPITTSATGVWDTCGQFFTKGGVLCVVCSNNNGCYDKKHGIYCVKGLVDGGVGDSTLCNLDPACVYIQN